MVHLVTEILQHHIHNLIHIIFYMELLIYNHIIMSHHFKILMVQQVLGKLME